MSRRSNIVDSIVALVNTNLNGTTYVSNIFNSAENKLQFFDEISNFPYVSITAGDEYREYLPNNFKWVYMNVVIRIYTNGSESNDELEQIFEDLEELLDINNNLVFDTGETLDKISITSITSSEGVMAPLEIGEMNIQCMYGLQGACPT